MVKNIDSLRDIQASIANTLNNMSDFDTQILSLDGFRKKINIGRVSVRLTHKVENKDEKLYDSSEWRTRRVFFLRDYEMIGDAIDEYKVVISVYRSFWYRQDTEITDSVEKRFYMLSIVILNEIERLKQLKKGKWKGKLHTPTFQLTQNQEKNVQELLQKSDFQDKTTMSEYLDMVRNYNLSRLYNQRKLKRKCCVFLNQLTKELGDKWGEIAAPISTNGEKTLSDIKKYY